ncbi:MAG: DUF4332 domain-containing protein [Gammaproteobacteria bacterium]|nr:DUF4332 domain-containing protein [Gammaproteobacteria bacterium]
MSELIREILVCLLVAFLLGVFFGWVFRAIKAKYDEEALTNQHDQRISDLSKRLKSRRAERHALLTSFKTDPSMATETGSELSEHEAHIEEYYIDAIEDIGSERCKILRENGVSMLNEFLIQYGNSKRSRQELAGLLAADYQQINQWISIADLMRVQGVGYQYAQLLEAAGIRSITELSQYRSNELLTKMKQQNKDSQNNTVIVKLPDQSQIKSWIEIAKSLSTMVSL